MGTRDASPVAFLQQMNLMLQLNLECLPHWSAPELGFVFYFRSLLFCHQSEHLETF